MALTESSSVADDRVLTAHGTSPRQEVQWDPPRLDVVSRLWQYDKENHGWLEGPPMTVLCQSFDLLAGPSPSGKVSSNEKRIPPFAGLPPTTLTQHWPVIFGKPEVGTHRGPLPIRFGDGGRMQSSSPSRGHCQVGPIQKKRLECP
jgi:hypothetical protein